MDLAAIFYISIYGLVCLAGAILAWAEGQLSLSIVLPPLALAALVFNERLRLIRLPATVINSCGVLSLLYPTFEAVSGSQEARLLAGAHVLVLLQTTLLFHRKTAYQYWWMCALSCMQIAVAAVLTSTPAFGLWILLYIFWATWTLSIYTLLLSRVRHMSVPTGDLAWQWPPLTLQETAPVPAETPQPSRSFGEFRSGTFEAPEGTGVSVRFVLGILGITTWAVAMGLLVFVLTPRVWLGGLNTFPDLPDLSGRAMTGFSDKVQLGDLGRILENPAPVMQVQVIDNDSNRPLRIQRVLESMDMDEPLLRGSVLTIYRDGEWFTEGRPSFRELRRTHLMDQSGLWRQQIRREPIGSRTLFSLMPTFYGRLEDHMGQVRRDPGLSSLDHTGSVFGDSLTYTLYSPAYPIRASFQELLPAQRPTEYTLEVCLRLPDNIPRLREFALLRIAEAEARVPLRMDRDRHVAGYIERWLRDRGEYTYTLDQSIQDPRIDPVEDFLLNRKSGHCQYYATALALLLREANIPTRVLTGFKGATTDSDPTVLMIQQRHAHAWVEAFISSENTWITLDATPAARDESVAEIGRKANWWSQTTSTMNGIWQDYVVNLSYARQQRDLYGPVKDWAVSTWENMQNLPAFADSVQSNLQTLWERPQTLTQPQNLLVLGLLGLFFLALFLGSRRLWHVGFGQRRYRWQVRTGRRVEWYEEFLHVLQQRHFKPLPHQTQQEFAAQLQRELASDWPFELQSLPERMTAAFYRLRFGPEEELPPEEVQELQRLLSDFKRLPLTRTTLAHPPQ